MSTATEKIPFEVDISRVIEVLAKQIYQSPLALLRENTQNAFDALLLRRHRDSTFRPRITVSIAPELISIEDNGIGMSRDDLRRHFWRAGASSKNTPEARAAGVVGTFGIGAMANFGIASELVVATESLATGERTTCRAVRDTLSATEDCIEMAVEPATGSAGTTITASIVPEHRVNVPQAVEYVKQFVSFLPIDVSVNGDTVSGQDLTHAVALPGDSWQHQETACQLDGSFVADVSLQVAPTAEVWVLLENIRLAEREISGRVVLRQAVSAIRTFRSGFGLATVSVNSEYALGGVADLLVLEPTAGREALSTESMQLLQGLVSALDSFVSRTLATRPEANNSTSFMSWAVRHGRLDLCGNLRIRIEPEGRELALDDVQSRTQAGPMLAYAGSDRAMIDAHASEDAPLLILATRNPRRQCEVGYLQKFCRVDMVSDQPKVIERRSQASMSMAEAAVVFRLANVLESDYFLRAKLTFGKMSHGLPIWVDQTCRPPEIVLDPEASTLAVVIGLYRSDYPTFSSMTKDFVRSVIFPRVADLVPSSTRQGAEAFLKAIRRPREVFEYEASDLQSLTDIWEEYVEGRLTIEQAAERSSVVARRSIQVVDQDASRAVRDVLPDVLDNEGVIQSGTGDGDDILGALPAIRRLDTACDAKLLTIPEEESPLKGYRCFLAITDRLREERGDFFMQPHRTSVVWGGQKVHFIFQHHSGRFGLYYDLQTSGVVEAKTGGGPFQTCTLLLKDRVFIPVPLQIQASFIPAAGEKKRFEVTSDLLYTDADEREET